MRWDHFSGNGRKHTKPDRAPQADEQTSGYCPSCSEPEMEYGTCKYCGHALGRDEQQSNT